MLIEEVLVHKLWCLKLLLAASTLVYLPYCHDLSLLLHILLLHLLELVIFGRGLDLTWTLGKSVSCGLKVVFLELG